MCLHPGMNLSGYTMEQMEYQLQSYKEGLVRAQSDPVFYGPEDLSYYKGRVQWMETQIRLRKEAEENAIKQAEYFAQKAAGKIAEEYKSLSAV